MKTNTHRLFRAVVVAVLLAPLFGFAQMFTPACGSAGSRNVNTSVTVTRSTTFGYSTPQVASSDYWSGQQYLATIPAQASPATVIIVRADSREAWIRGSSTWPNSATPYPDPYAQFSVADNRSTVVGCPPQPQRCRTHYDDPYRRQTEATIMGAVVGGIIQRQRGGNVASGILAGGAAGYVLAGWR